MKKITVLTQALSAGLIFAGQANAAVYEYVFQDNVVVFPFSSTDMSQNITERLSAPFLNMTVTDTTNGIDVSIRINESFSGWLDSMFLDHMPGLGFGTAVHYRPASSSSVPPSEPYFYSVPDGIDSLGTAYDISAWTPISTILGFSYGNAFGDSLTVHFRNLPEEISAANFTPKYLQVRETSWGKASNGQAFVLASPIAAVPEPTSAALLCAGIALIGWSARTRFSRTDRQR